MSSKEFPCDKHVLLINIYLVSKEGRCWLNFLKEAMLCNSVFPICIPVKHVQSELDILEDQKQHLQIYLEERVQEADSLNSKIEELEMQLSMEKEECRRYLTYSANTNMVHVVLLGKPSQLDYLCSRYHPNKVIPSFRVRF